MGLEGADGASAWVAAYVPRLFPVDGRRGGEAHEAGRLNLAQDRSPLEPQRVRTTGRGIHLRTN